MKRVAMVSTKVLMADMAFRAGTKLTGKRRNAYVPRPFQAAMGRKILLNRAFPYFCAAKRLLMRTLTLALVLISLSFASFAQKSETDRLKAGLESAANPLEFLKAKKRKYRIDTVFITSNVSFSNGLDSLAYHGQVRKVDGPFPEDSVLLQVVGKAPNMFYHVQQIFLDTSKMRKEVAVKLADSIIARVKRKEKSFGDMARIYAMDGSGPNEGELGWRARGTLIPPLENAILKHKKGELFKTFSPYGLHIIYMRDSPKQDVGFVLILRVFL